MNIWAVERAVAGLASNGILLEARLNFSSARANPIGFLDIFAPVSSARYSLDREQTV